MSGPATGPSRSTAVSPRARLAVVIVNPVKVAVDQLRATVAAEEQRNGWQPSEWLQTAGDDPGQSAARAALTQRPAVVIVAGGDGTIRAVAEEIASSGVPLAIVPAGTGNLLARNLGLMARPEEAVRTAFAGSDRAIDVGIAELEREDGSATTEAFLVMTGIGLDATMAADTNRTLKKYLGWLAYTDPIGRSILGNQRFTLHYRVDEAAEQSIQAHTVIVGNCGTLTAGLLLLPDAAVDDGLLDVVLFRPKGFRQWSRVGLRLVLGRVLHRTRGGRMVLRASPRLRALEYRQAQRLTARFDAPQLIQLDGDSFGRIVAVQLSLRYRELLVRFPS